MQCRVGSEKSCLWKEWWFYIYNLKIGKIEIEISLLRGEWGCEILVDNFCSEFWKFFASPSLCSNCMSLIYFTHLLYTFVLLCSVFASNIFSIIYLFHPIFASFFQNSCIFRKLRYSLKFWTVKEVTCLFLC